MTTWTLTALTDVDPPRTGHRLAWVAADGNGIPAGTAYLQLFTDSGRADRCELDLHVHPAERRRGVGSLLLDAACRAARADGRRTLAGEAAADSPGDAFLAARGFRRVLVLRYARLPLASVDLAALDALVQRPHPGYRLVAWSGTVPDELAAGSAEARRALDDMPLGESAPAPVVWDADRLRAAAQRVEARGDVLDTVSVLADDGTVVGFTELVLPGDGRGDGQHYGTGVLPEHRGRGLARWMKAEAVRRARRQWPELDGLLADTAEDNAAMRRVNDALGYAPTHVSHAYELTLVP